jgi:hypothetical protein
MKIQGFIGKTITGIRTANLARDGTEADSITFMFSDGKELSFTNEYLEGFGWTRIGIDIKDDAQ